MTTDFYPSIDLRSLRQEYWLTALFLMGKSDYDKPEFDKENMNIVGSLVLGLSCLTNILDEHDVTGRKPEGGYDRWTTGVFNALSRRLGKEEFNNLPFGTAKVLTESGLKDYTSTPRPN